MANESIQLRLEQSLDKVKLDLKLDNYEIVFGDIKPSKFEYVDSLLDLISIYNSSSDGFLRRRDRPELFRSNILGRLPPISTNSSLVSYLFKG